MVTNNLRCNPYQHTIPPNSIRRIVSLSIQLLIISNLLVDSLCAPQLSAATANKQSKSFNQVPPQQTDDTAAEKTADLTLLINETLSLNNKSANVHQLSAGIDRHSFKDDWTFDMVEYDLMEFLQDLSARYRLANGNKNLTDDESSMAASGVLEGKKDTSLNELKKELALQDKEQANNNNNSKSQQNEQSTAAAANSVNQQPSAAATKQPELPPISLASGDHDFAESTWQYGIFDRFTRPRSTTTTTTTTPDPLSLSSSNLDVRSFNSDECGLRTYVEDEPSHFPTIDEEQTASKELNQRRQRPPLGSSFFSSHKKFQSSSLADEILDSERLESSQRPPFDSFGGPAASPPQSSSSSLAAAAANAAIQTAEEDEMLNKHWPPSPLDSNSGNNSPADSEFNLSFRRQWLQQQLGQTLSMLGFNSTSAGKLAFADFLNDTYQQQSAAAGSRENMMKKSNKFARSIDRLDQDNLEEPMAAAPLKRSSSVVDPSSSSSSSSAVVELTEQELKARQDELKLEARVIGGSDARLGDSPWSVSLQALVARPGTGGVEYRHYCGGTIISEYYVLTAAHCLDFMVGRESRLFVVIGDLNWRMSAGSLHGRRFGIEKLIIHSGYKSTAFGHDIGLIRTKESMKPLKVNGRYIINSVCLPEKGVEHSGEAELVGWGLFSNRNEMADSLQIADVPILPRPLCVDLYKRRTGLIQWLIGIELITEKQVCAGTFGRGICQGDSGSALVFNEKVSRVFSSATSSSSQQHHHSGRPSTSRPTSLAAAAASSSLTRRFSNVPRDQQSRATIIGIVAFGGIRRCSYQSLPGVYMQTSKYMDWIMPRIQS